MSMLASGGYGAPAHEDQPYMTDLEVRCMNGEVLKFRIPLDTLGRAAWIC